MKTWRWFTTLVCMGAAVAACTTEEVDPDDDDGTGGNGAGQGGATTTMGGPAGPVTTTTTTGMGGMAPTFDEAGAFSFQLAFDIAAAGATTGQVFIQYLDSVENQTDVCLDVYDFTATMAVPANLVACNEGITDVNDPSCRDICPLDLDDAGLTGTCIGNLSGFTVTGKNAASDCDFAPNGDPFADTTQFALFEQYFFSQPVQTSLATNFTGMGQPATWGEFATNVSMANQNAPGALQIERLLPDGNGNLFLTQGMAEARHWGITISPNGGETDPMAMGQHFAFFTFLFGLN